MKDADAEAMSEHAPTEPFEAGVAYGRVVAFREARVTIGLLVGKNGG